MPTCGADAGVIADDLDGVMRGVYGSTAGALISYSTAPFTHITPCIGTPGRCYTGVRGRRWCPGPWLWLLACLQLTGMAVPAEQLLRPGFVPQHHRHELRV